MSNRSATTTLPASTKVGEFDSDKNQQSLDFAHYLRPERSAAVPSIVSRGTRFY
jgi:hypothetical protein